VVKFGCACTAAFDKGLTIAYAASSPSAPNRAAGICRNTTAYLKDFGGSLPRTPTKRRTFPSI